MSSATTDKARDLVEKAQAHENRIAELTQAKETLATCADSIAMMQVYRNGRHEELRQKLEIPKDRAIARIDEAIAYNERQLEPIRTALEIANKLATATNGKEVTA